MQKRISNILVIRNDRFGEFLLIIPALRALKERYPQAKITLAIDTYLMELAGLVEEADSLIAWENRKHSFKEILAFSRQIKKGSYDLAVVFNPASESNLAIFLAGVPLRIGYDRKWGFLLTHKIKDEKHLALKHEVEYNLGLVALTGAFTHNLKLGLKSAPDYLFPETLKGVNFIAIHPWTSDPVKQWPVERFKELAQRIRRELGLIVVLVGSSKDALDGDEGVINLANKTSLPELTALLKRASLLVSGDSGPVHLAAAVGTPVVALFRNDLPGKAAKRWGPWGEGHIIIEKDKLEDISVDEVLNAVRRKI